MHALQALAPEDLLAVMMLTIAAGASASLGHACARGRRAARASCCAGWGLRQVSVVSDHARSKESVRCRQRRLSQLDLSRSGWPQGLGLGRR